MSEPGEPIQSNHDRMTGRFVPGNKAGGARDVNRQMYALRKGALEAVTPEDIGRVMRELLDMALRSRRASVRIAAARVLGDFCGLKPATIMIEDAGDNNILIVLPKKNINNDANDHSGYSAPSGPAALCGSSAEVQRGDNVAPVG
jgi:hypothetical protein